MPNIIITNWNIEKLSANKTAIAEMATNIGKIIATAHNPPGMAPTGADIAIILEISEGTAVTAMTQVSSAANTASIALGGNGNDYRGWLLSYDTGGECYGVLIKNMNVVRPIRVTAGPSGQGIDDAANAFLENLDQNQFATWPAPFLGAWGMLNVYPLPAAGMRPRLPLTDLFASIPPQGRKRKRFSGQTLTSRAGYALGRGFRMPCLAMFEILNNATNATYLLPILACHLGAVRSGANHLAFGQINQYRLTHIAQKFQNGRYIALNGAPKVVQELVIMGDFNIDFLQQFPPAPNNNLRKKNRRAYNSITPSTINQGSAAPPALPGVPGVAPAVPFPMPPGGWPNGPISNMIPNLALKAANTSGGTILHHYHAPIVPANTIVLRGACFDDIFFGGTQLSANYQPLTPVPGVGPPAVNDACFVHDVPAQIVNAIPVGTAAAAAQSFLDVSGAYTYYLAQPRPHRPGTPPPVPPNGTHDTLNAPNLAPGAAGPLNNNDRLIGARFISDHLPVLIQVNFP